MAARQILPAPLDGLGIDVDSMELRAAVKEPADGTAAAAPKIQHATCIRQIDVLLNNLRAAFANAEEWGHRNQFADAIAEHRGGHRDMEARHPKAILKPEANAQGEPKQTVIDGGGGGSQRPRDRALQTGKRS
jgi:hypothetical protein